MIPGPAPPAPADPGRDGVGLVERPARRGAGGAGGDQRLGLAPAAGGGQRRALEPLPGAGGLVGVVGADGAQGSGAEAVGLVPLAAGDRRLDPVGDQRAVVAPIGAEGLQRRLGQPRRLPRPAQHRQHVGEGDVGPLQHHGVGTLFGGPLDLPLPLQPLSAVSEVGEVAAEHRQRPLLGRARADPPGDRERLLTDRQRLVEASGQAQPGPEHRQGLRALRRRRLLRHQLHGPLERG